jgi:aminopeptidase YwaD
MPNSLPDSLDHDDLLWEDFAALCRFGGRLTGTPGEAAAGDWAVERLNALGVGQLSRTLTPYIGWECLDSHMELSSGVALNAYPLLYSAGTPESGLVLDVVDCGRGTPEDIRSIGRNLEGRAALVRHEYMFASDTVHRWVKLRAAIDAGAAAFLIAAPTRGLGAVSGSALTNDTVTPIPAFGISAETAEQIIVAAPARIRIRLTTELRPKAQTETIVLDIPGEGPERVVLSAHIDGHALGESALDNATGVALALALARAAAPHEGILPRGLTICLFSAEEWALTGSKAWLAGLSETVRRQFAFNLNLDTVVGGSRLTALTSGFSGLGALVTEAVNGIGADLGVHLPLMRNSDHANFADHGIPALRLVSGFDEPNSKIRLLLTRHDRADLAALEDFVEPTRVAWGILRTALTAPADRLAALRAMS